MLIFLRGPLLGIITLLFCIFNTVFWSCLLFVIAIFKLILPIKKVRSTLSKILTAIASYWMYCNTTMIKVLIGIKWEVQSDVTLSRSQWYLIIANHQSWADIIALGVAFNLKTPFIKFFLKKKLIYVPLLGLAWWALDFPFMHRLNKKTLLLKPHLRDKDLETTMKACAQFKKIPSTIMNFVEGTRFTDIKHRSQKSPYQHLLRAKAGGVAYTLQIMGEQLTGILDVTIVYSNKYKTLWDLLCGRVRKVKIYIRSLPITADLLGDYQNDKQFRIHFQAYLNHVWADKDKLIQQGLTS